MSDNQREAEEREAETHRSRILSENRNRAVQAQSLSIKQAHECVRMIVINLLRTIICEFKVTNKPKLH